MGNANATSFAEGRTGVAERTAEVLARGSAVDTEVAPPSAESNHMFPKLHPEHPPPLAKVPLQV